VGALVALYQILGIDGRNAEMAQVVVVTTVWDAGEMLPELEEGLGTAVALWGLAGLVHAGECDGRQR